MSLPFVLTNDNVGSIATTSETWIGQFDPSITSPWIDLFIAMVITKKKWSSFNLCLAGKLFYFIFWKFYICWRKSLQMLHPVYIKEKGKIIKKDYSVFLDQTFSCFSRLWQNYSLWGGLTIDHTCLCKLFQLSKLFHFETQPYMHVESDGVSLYFRYLAPSLGRPTFRECCLSEVVDRPRCCQLLELLVLWSWPFPLSWLEQ